jgi:serine/threonine-protein kinase
MGGMAELFLAQSTGAHGFEKTVVIKRILPHLAKDEHFTSMFITEAKLTAQLVHPKIAQTYELGTEDNQLFIAMEYVEGLDVLAVLRELAHRRTRLRPALAVYIAKEVLDALDFAHKLTDAGGAPLGIVHRDISPSNVVISRRGDVKLVDFGIAHAVATDHKTRAGTLKGKYGYMSPEQVLGRKVSPRSDLFSTGILLAEMLMGRRLFAGQAELDVLLMVRDVRLDRLERYGRHIAPSLIELLHKAMAKDPDARFEDSGHFRDVLEEWLFENRERIGGVHLAELVESLYEDSTNRRREALDVDRAAANGEPAAAPEAIPQPIAVGSDTSAPEVQILEAIDSELASGDVPDESSAPEIELVEENVDPAEAAMTMRVPALADRPTSVVKELERGPDSVEAELSVRYPTIEAAVAAAVPQEPDPAARDFDDREVGSVDRLSGRLSQRMPTAQEVARAARPVPPELQELGNQPDESGDLGETSALSLIVDRALERSTGLLVIAFGPTRKDIFIREGVPEFVSSNVAGELFGAYLVQERVISEGELDMALAMMPHYGGKLGEALVGLGLVKPLEVFRHLTRQVRSRIIDVCTWEKGAYSWFEGITNAKEAFPLDLDPFEVAGAGAMEISASFIDRWAAELAKARPRSASRGRLVPESFKLGVKLRDTYNRLTGKRTVSELTDHYSDATARGDFLRRLFLLMAARLAYVGGRS